jgi:uncharacterized membrane protein
MKTSKRLKFLSLAAFMVAIAAVVAIMVDVAVVAIMVDVAVVAIMVGAAVVAIMVGAAVVRQAVVLTTHQIRGSKLQFDTSWGSYH